MLPQRFLKALNLSRITQSSLPISTSCIHQNQNHKHDFPDAFSLDVDPSDKVPERKLKEWRESYQAKEQIIPINSDNSFFKLWRSQIELTPWGLAKYYKNKNINQQIELQRLDPQRRKFMGADLTLAQFLIFMGGKIRFRGNDQWISLEVERSKVDLPSRFDPNYVVSEVDASETLLRYEGLENFKGCSRIKWASFARCPYIDDWCVDRMASFFPFIEYLDLSDCPKLSERGLEALYKTGFLQTLIVTNHYKSASFELTCMMLEDVVPGLQIDIREPKEKMKPLINEA